MKNQVFARVYFDLFIFGLIKEIQLNLPNEKMVKLEHNTVTSHNKYVYIRCYYLVNLVHAVNNNQLDVLKLSKSNLCSFLRSEVKTVADFSPCKM